MSVLRWGAAVLLTPLVLLACHSTESGEGSASSSTRRRPNILLIVADDLGYADCGFTGSRDVRTPSLDRLAQAGVRFTDAHVSASVCAPSRAGLLTGRYQQEFGFECNLGGKGGLLTGERTLARALGSTGYRTIAIGKWHLGHAPEQHPMEQGFEHFTGLLGGSRSYFPIEDKQPSAGQRIERDRVPVAESEFEYLTDFLSDEAIARIGDREVEEPFFLYLSYTAPHSPNHARPDLFESYSDAIPDKGRRTYASMVSAMDEGIGRVVEALDARGELDDTLIVFLSDNGGATTNHSDNGPWRGMKGSKWEGGQRVPFLVHWPAAFDAQVFDGMTSSLDIMPTALAAAGVEGVAQDSALDGVDLLPHLRGSTAEPPHERLFWRRSVAAAVRSGDWKLIRVTELDGSFAAPVLVNLRTHPDEYVDLAGDQAERVRSMLADLAAWEQTLVEPRWREGKRWEANQRAKHRPDARGREAERRLP